MSYNQFPQDQNQRPASVSQRIGPTGVSQDEADHTPSRDEVARRAYFHYLDAGSVPGHDVQHWLKAEDELLAERSFARLRDSFN